MAKLLGWLADRFGLLAGLLLIVVGLAVADQSNTWSPTTGTVSGLQLTNNYNGGFSALQSSNSGATAPANDISGVAVKGQWWLDTSVTPNILKYYDGTQWTVVGYLDTTNHRWNPPIGGGTDTIASAATTDLGTKSSGYLTISGTTTITGFGSTAVTGTAKIVTFSGILTLTHSSPGLILPSAANITTAVGDTAVAVATGSGNWTVVAYQRADGQALSAAGNFTSAVFFNAGISPANLTVSQNNWNPAGLSTANVIRFSCNNGVNITGLTAPVTGGQVLILDNIGSTNACTLMNESTSSTAANRFSIVQSYPILPLTQVAVRYDNTSQRWKFIHATTTQPISGTARNMRVFNVATALGDSAPATPATMISIAADAITVENAAGVARRLTSYSCTIDFTVNGAGGLDTGALSQPNWYAVFVIYNPITGGQSCIGSLQSSYASVTQPSGYTFAVRVGWGYYVTANALTEFRRFVQYNNHAQYVLVAATNSIALPQMYTGVTGNVTTPTFTTVAVSTFLPPTATRIYALMTAAASSSQILAPNPNYGGIGSLSNPSPCFTSMTGSSANMVGRCNFALESTNVYVANNNGSQNTLAIGWDDNLR